MLTELVVWPECKAEEEIPIPFPGTYEGVLDEEMQSAVFNTLEGHIYIVFEEITRRVPVLQPVMSSGALAEMIDQTDFDYARGWKEMSELWLQAIVDEIESKKKTKLHIYPYKLLEAGPSSLFLGKTSQRSLRRLFELTHPYPLSKVIVDSSKDDPYSPTDQTNWRLWGSPLHWEPCTRRFLLEAILVQLAEVDNIQDAMTELWFSVQNWAGDAIFAIGEAVWEKQVEQIHEQIPYAYKESDRKAVRDILKQIESERVRRNETQA